MKKKTWDFYLSDNVGGKVLAVKVELTAYLRPTVYVAGNPFVKFIYTIDKNPVKTVPSNRSQVFYSTIRKYGKLILESDHEKELDLKKYGSLDKLLTATATEKAYLTFTFTCDLSEKNTMLCLIRDGFFKNTVVNELFPIKKTLVTQKGCFALRDDYQTLSFSVQAGKILYCPLTDGTLVGSYIEACRVFGTKDYDMAAYRNLSMLKDFNALSETITVEDLISCGTSTGINFYCRFQDGSEQWDFVTDDDRLFKVLDELKDIKNFVIPIHSLPEGSVRMQMRKHRFVDKMNIPMDVRSFNRYWKKLPFFQGTKLVEFK